MATTRSILRSASLRTAASNLAGAAKPSARPSLRLPSTPRSVASRFLRSPVEMSCCVESLLPMHSTTASAVMTSLLSMSIRGSGWLSEDG